VAFISISYGSIARRLAKVIGVQQIFTVYVAAYPGLYEGDIKKGRPETGDAKQIIHDIRCDVARLTGHRKGWRRGEAREIAQRFSRGQGQKTAIPSGLKATGNMRLGSCAHMEGRGIV
jgi:hypothetical protein